MGKQPPTERLRLFVLREVSPVPHREVDEVIASLRHEDDTARRRVVDGILLLTVVPLDVDGLDGVNDSPGEGTQLVGGE
jgi:hypothetical protein